MRKGAEAERDCAPNFLIFLFAPLVLFCGYSLRSSTMTFLAGGLAIAGAVAVLIPILIHLLLRRRRQPVPWAAMQFLLQAIKRQKRRLQIEQWLLLAARCLIVLLAGLALARPVLEQAVAGISAGGSRHIVLIIDNSLASTLRDEDGRSALDAHLAAAGDVIESLGPGDAVSLITAAQPAQALIDPASGNFAAVQRVIEELEPSLTPADIPAALSLADGALGRRASQYRSAAVYLLSDFRAGSANLDERLRAMEHLGERAVSLIASPPAANTVTNVQVVAVEPIRSVVLAGETLSDQVVVRLKRHGGELGQESSRLRLLAGNTPLAEPRVVEWAAGQSDAEAQFVVTLPRQSDRHISLTAAIDQDRLPADDARHTIVESRRQLRVAMLARRDFGFDRSIDQLTPAQWINRALTPREDSQLQVAEVDPTALDARDLRGADIAFLPRPDQLQDEGWTALRDFVDAGGVLVISPPEDQLVHPWTAKLSDVLGMPWRVRVERVDLDDPEPLSAEQPRTSVMRLLSGELGALAPAVMVARRLDIDDDPSRGDAVLVTESGKPFVLAGTPGAENRSTSQLSEGESPGRQVNSGDSTTRSGSEGVARSAESAAQSSTSRGMVVLFASAPHLDWTTLPAKPLMVPLVQELVRQGVSVIRAQQEMIVGQPSVPWLPPSAASIVAPSGVVSPVRLSAPAGVDININEPGIARVLDATGQEVSSFAVNIDPASGRTEIQGAPAVAAWLASAVGGAPGRWSFIETDDPAGELRTASSGMHLAGMLLALLLALVLVETLMARWFSHATQSSRGLEAGGIQPAVAGKHGTRGTQALRVGSPHRSESGATSAHGSESRDTSAGGARDAE
jgi:hypothetical protein